MGQGGKIHNESSVMQDKILGLLCIAFLVNLVSKFCLIRFCPSQNLIRDKIKISYNHPWRSEVYDLKVKFTKHIIISSVQCIPPSR